MGRTKGEIGVGGSTGVRQKGGEGRHAGLLETESGREADPGGAAGAKVGGEGSDAGMGYSCLRATLGSTREARWAGREQAATATIIKSAATVV